METSWPRPVVWLGDSRERLRSFPRAVREEIGFALYQAQTGQKHILAKPLKGFGSGVLEIVSDAASGTYRAVYVVRLAGRVYVLLAFQKKSKAGVATPKRHLDLIRQRLRQAMKIHRQ